MRVAHRFEGHVRPDREGVQAREATLEKYLALVRRMENYFKSFTMDYIKRNKNTKAGELVKAAARNMPLPTDVFFQVMEDASVKTIEPELRLINIIGEGWRASIIGYLRHCYEPDNNIVHNRMQ
jgi:hypothetical protein